MGKYLVANNPPDGEPGEIKLSNNNEFFHPAPHLHKIHTGGKAADVDFPLKFALKHLNSCRRENTDREGGRLSAQSQFVRGGVGGEGEMTFFNKYWNR